MLRKRAYAHREKKWLQVVSRFPVRKLLCLLHNTSETRSINPTRAESAVVLASVPRHGLGSGDLGEEPVDRRIEGREVPSVFRVCVRGHQPGIGVAHQAAQTQFGHEVGTVLFQIGVV